MVAAEAVAPHDRPPLSEIRIVEGSVAERRFLAWYRRGDRLVGALAMNEAKSLMLSKTLIERRTSWNEGMAAFEKATAS